VQGTGTPKDREEVNERREVLYEIYKHQQIKKKNVFIFYLLVRKKGVEML
jgi:hypothetical protein